MNILPFITLFILTISLVIFSTVQSHYSTNAVFTGLDGYFHHYRSVKNELEEKVFQSKKKPKNGASKGARNAQKSGKKKYVSSRLQTASASARLNIEPLLDPKFEDKEKKKIVKEAFIRLLHILYDKAPFFSEIERADPVGDLVNELIAAASGASKLERLEDLIPQSEDLATLWYKCLKGEPRLSHYAIIIPLPSKTALSFRSASIPVLEAFFSKEITEQILEAEEEKYNNHQKNTHLNKEEYTALLKGVSGQKLALVTGGTFPKNEERLIRKDPKTGIVIDLAVPPKMKESQAKEK